MPRQKPQVIAGMRGPRDTRMESMAEVERAESNPELAQVTLAGLDPKKGTLYFSKFPGYIVQITSPGDNINPVTGQRTRTRGIKAVFKQGRYLNDNKDKQLRKFIDDTLQQNSRFGKPGQSDFWLAEEQERVIRERSIENARATLRSLPKEVVDEFIGSLKKGDEADHDLTETA